MIHSSSNWNIPLEMLVEEKNELWDYCPQPLENEAFLSWFTRLAKENCSDVDLLYQKLRNPYSGRKLKEGSLEIHLEKLETNEKIRNDLIEILSLHITLPTLQIKKLLFNTLKSTTIWDYLSIPLETPRYCPKCLKEDKIPYFRSHWFLKFITSCENHRIFLKDVCPHCYSPINFWKTNWDQQIDFCYYCQKDIKQEIIQQSEVENIFQKKLLRIFKTGYFNEKTNSVSYFQQLWKIINMESKDRRIKDMKSNLISLSPERTFKALLVAHRCLENDNERFFKPFVCLKDGLKFSSEMEWKMHVTQAHESNSGEIKKSGLSQYQINEEMKNMKVVEAIKQGQYYKQIISEFKISYGKYQKLKTLYYSYLNKEISPLEFNKKLIPQKPVGRRKTKLFDVDENSKVLFIDKSFEDAITQCLQSRGGIKFSEAWKIYKRIKQCEAFNAGITSKGNEILTKLLSLSKATSLFNHATYHIFYDELHRYCPIVNNS